METQYAAPLLDMGLLWTLFAQFALISLIAFGGGQTVLPLIERESVGERGWTTSAALTAAVGFGYLIPGPVTTMATFIGYQAAGFGGAIACTLGMFLAPTILAAIAAAGVEHLAENRWIRAFDGTAMPAAIGLLGATLWSMGKHALTSPAMVLIAGISLAVAAWTKVSPVFVLLSGALIGWAVSLARL